MEEAIGQLEDYKKRLSRWPPNSRLQKEMTNKAVACANNSFALCNDINKLTDAAVRKTSPDYHDALGLLPPGLKRRMLEAPDGDTRQKRRMDNVVVVDDFAAVQASGSGNVGDGLDNVPAASVQASGSGNVGDGLDNVPAASVLASQNGSAGGSVDDALAAIASNRLRWGCSVQ